MTFTQFQRVCWHWLETNRKVIEANFPPEQSRRIKLEDLVADEAILRDCCQFLDIPFDVTMLDVTKKPTHVYVPIDFGLSAEQSRVFSDMCGGLMDVLNYDLEKPVYEMEY